jgi:hypothetical protein
LDSSNGILFTIWRIVLVNVWMKSVHHILIAAAVQFAMDEHIGETQDGPPGGFRS